MRVRVEAEEEGEAEVLGGLGEGVEDGDGGEAVGVAVEGGREDEGRRAGRLRLDLCGEDVAVGEDLLLGLVDVGEDGVGDLLDAGGVEGGALEEEEARLVALEGAAARGREEEVPGGKREFPTLEAHISIVFHSIWLTFGRAIISRGELKAWMLFCRESLREHPR